GGPAVQPRPWRRHRSVQPEPRTIAPGCRLDPPRLAAAEGSVLASGAAPAAPPACLRSCAVERPEQLTDHRLAPVADLDSGTHAGRAAIGAGARGDRFTAGVDQLGGQAKETLAQAHAAGD